MTVLGAIVVVLRAALGVGLVDGLNFDPLAGDVILEKLIKVTFINDGYKSALLIVSRKLR